MRGDATRARMWAIALTLLLAPAAAAQPRPAVAPPSGHLERAQAEFQAGRYTEALEEARRAADSAPTSGRALTARASMAEFLGEVNEARTFYDRAVALAPDEPGGIYHPASFAVRGGEDDRALGPLHRLLVVHPRH